VLQVHNTAIHRQGHVNLGIKGGVNIYNIHNDNDTKYDIRAGYNFWLTRPYTFRQSICQFSLKLYILPQGAKNGDTKYNLNYVNVPVLFQYMFDNGFRLQAGPQVGFLVSAKIEKTIMIL